MEHQQPVWLRHLQKRGGKIVALILTTNAMEDSLSKLKKKEVLKDFPPDTPGQFVRSLAVSEGLIKKLEHIQWGPPISVEGWAASL